MSSKSIYPCIWFNGNAAEAVALYTAAFGNTSITANNGLVVAFEIGGCKLIGLNGGPTFTPNASISFFVNFQNEASINKAWQLLSERGQVFMEINKYPWSERYGWIQDRFGVSWQLMLQAAPVASTIVPSLMFTKTMAGRAEEAIQFYISLFPHSSVEVISRYEEGEGDIAGTIKYSRFFLNSQPLIAMDSSHAHAFSFDEGVSIVVDCDTQEEIDHYWSGLLSDGGNESMCGWLKDKFGVSWQVVPTMLPDLMRDPARADRVMKRLLKMKKLLIEELINA